MKPLSGERKVFWAECLDLAKTPEEDMLIKKIFTFIAKQDAKAVSRLKEDFCEGKGFDTKMKTLCKKGDNFYCTHCGRIDEIFGEFK